MSELQRNTLAGTDLLNMPGDQRYELIDGVLVTMAPASFRHGIVALQIGFLLKAHNAKHKLGRVIGAETGFYTRGDTKSVRAPDVAYMSYASLAAGPLPAVAYLDIPPDLVVDVVSPGDRADEIEQKTQEWLDFGVKVVWIVYPESQRVHVFAGRHDVARILNASDSISTSSIGGNDLLPGFEAPVSAFFED